MSRSCKLAIAAAVLGFGLLPLGARACDGGSCAAAVAWEPASPYPAVLYNEPAPPYYPFVSSVRNRPQHGWQAHRGHATAWRRTHGRPCGCRRARAY